VEYKQHKIELSIDSGVARIYDPAGEVLFRGRPPSKGLFQWFQEFVDNIKLDEKLIDNVSNSSTIAQYTKCNKCQTTFTGLLREVCPDCGSGDTEWEWMK
jgi:hypothetical protein